MQQSAKITTLATVLMGALFDSKDARAADNNFSAYYDGYDYTRLNGFLSLNWGGVIGEDLPYKRFATGV